MRKLISFGAGILGVLALAVFTLPSGAASSGNGRSVSLPESAVRVSDGVFSLGHARDPQSGRQVEGYAIVRYKKDSARPEGTSARAPKNSCYGYLASGAKWKTVEPWVLNGANAYALPEADLFANVGANIAKWEDAGDGVMGSGTGANILGNGSLASSSLAADTISPDGVNEVYFSPIDDAGAIAVTIVWGIFGGPPSGRELIEWDQVYDDADYGWSLSGEAGEMDFENIATHELGHSVGLADLYTSGCAEETMYGYADFGETKKRDLNAGDIAGINKLY